MEFWGVEVKSGEPLKIEIEPTQFVLHLSQAALGVVKKDKGNESVCLYLKITDRVEKILLGTLNPENLQLSFDLVFEKQFELSHNGKNGSVYFSGYKILQPESDDDSELSEPEFDIGKGLPVASNNGPGTKQQPPAQKDKLNSTERKQKVKIIEPSKDDKACEESDDTDDDSNSSSEDDTSDDQDMTANREDEYSSQSEDEEEVTPKIVQKEKKRSAEPAMRIPVLDKKAKLVTPQKSDGKKASDHIATPHPAKKIVKPASAKSDQTKKSYGCASCNRSFGSEVALQSHTKAKHSAGQ